MKKEMIISIQEELEEYRKTLSGHKQIDANDDITELDRIAARVVSDDVLENKNDVVRQCAGCCLADILHIYAPTAPYSQVVLKRVFKFIIQRLHGLQQPQNSNTYRTSFYILERLAITRSSCILIDIQDDPDDTETTEELMVSLFEALVSSMVPSRESLVESYALQMIAGLLDELERITPRLLSVLLLQLLPEQKQDSPQAFALVSKVIVGLLDRLREPLSELVNSWLTGIASSKITDDEYDENSSNAGPTLVNISEATEISDRVLDVIYALFQMDHSFLLYITPNIVEHLQVDDLETRKSFVDLSGKIFLDLTTEEFVLENKPFWNAFLRRILDIDTDIRLSLVQFCGCCFSKDSEDMQQPWRFKYFTRPAFLENHEQSFLAIAMEDKDFAVRRAAVACACDCIQYTTETSKTLVDPNVLPSLTEAIATHMSDKKIEIACNATESLMRLYKNSYGERGESSLQLEWLPNTVLEHCIQGRQIPQETALFQWTACNLFLAIVDELESDAQCSFWLEVWQSLSSRGTRGFQRLFLEEPARLSKTLLEVTRLMTQTPPTKTSKTQRNIFGDTNGSKNTPADNIKNATALLERICQVLPQSRCKGSIAQLLSVKDKLVWRDMSNILKAENRRDAKAAIKSTNQRLGSKSDAAQMIKCLADRMVVFTKSTFERFFDSIETGVCATTTIDLLNEILTNYPQFATHEDSSNLRQRCEALIRQSSSLSDDIILMVLRLLRTIGSQETNTRDVEKIIFNHTNCRVVKTAVNVFVCCGGLKRDLFAKLNKEILELLDADKVKCLNRLAASFAGLGMLIKRDRETNSLHEEREALMPMIMARVMQEYTSRAKYAEVDVKVQGIRAISSGIICAAIHQGHLTTENTLNYKKQVLMLRRFVADCGDPWGRDAALKEHQAKETLEDDLSPLKLQWPPSGEDTIASLRLESACALLRIESATKNSVLLKEDAENLPQHREIQRYLELSRLAQDPLERVREKFISVLCKHMLFKGLHLQRYGVLLILAVAHAGGKSLTWLHFQQLLGSLTSAFHRRKRLGDSSFVHFAPEMMFSFLIYLLAHHPAMPQGSVTEAQDFVKSYQGQKVLVKPVMTMLEGLGKNIQTGMIFRLVDSIRQYQDRLEPKCINIHIVAEIVRLVVKSRASISPESLEYAGDIIMPIMYVEPSPVNDVEWPQSPISHSSRRKMAPQRNFEQILTDVLPQDFELHAVAPQSHPKRKRVNKIGSPPKRKSPVRNVEAIKATREPPARKARANMRYDEDSGSEISDSD